MKLIDRSRHEEWWKCPQSRHWKYDFNGTGLDFGNGPDILVGQAFHERVAAILTGGDPSPLPDALSVEERWIVQGLLHEWKQTRGPQLFERYCVEQHPQLGVMVEKEWVWSPHPALGVMTKLDGVLRNVETGALRILEHKTSKWAESPEWMEKWSLNLQVWMECGALASLYPGETIEAVEITALQTGAQKDDPDLGPVRWGPLTVAYQKGDQWSSKYKAGWSKTYLPSTFPSVQEMYAEVKPCALSLIEVIPPTYEQVALFTAQMVEVELGDMAPRRNLLNCKGWGKGKACPALGLCWQGEDPADYPARTPHHSSEHCPEVQC